MLNRHRIGLHVWVVTALMFSCEIAQGTTISWVAKASMPSYRAELAVTSSNDKIYAVGGNDSSVVSDLTEYNPATNAWNTINLAMTARDKLGADVISGFIYAVGGVNGSGTAMSTNERYDIANGYWQTKTGMSTARYWHAVVACSGKLYAIGGWGSALLDTVEEYDPTGNVWAYKATMPTARYQLASAVVNGKIYAIGGTTNGSNALSTVEEYNPTINTWTTKTSMPTNRRSLAVAVVNGKIYAMGGATSTSGLTTVEEYDPATDTWATGTSMNSARTAFGASTVNNKLYVVGGPPNPPEEGTVADVSSGSQTVANYIGRINQGEMKIANNVIDPGGHSSTTARTATIVIQGRLNDRGNVDFRLYSQAGLDVMELARNVQLDSNGMAVITFDGKKAGKPLPGGIYWVVASGATSAKARILIKHQ